MRTGPILLEASGEGAVPSPARLLLNKTLPNKPTNMTLKTQILVAIAHLHRKVVGIYLVVGTYLYAQDSHPMRNRARDYHPTDGICLHFSNDEQKDRQGSVYE